MRKLLVALLLMGLVESSPLFAAEDDPLVTQELELTVRALYLRSEVVVSGQFTDIEVYSDSDDLGQQGGRVDLAFVPDELFKGNVPTQQALAVQIWADSLPYKDWMISRGTARALRETERKERREELQERLRQTEVLQAQGDFSMSEISQLREISQKLYIASEDQSTAAAAAQSHGTRSSRKEVIYLPGEKYLLFLSRNSPENGSGDQILSIDAPNQGVFWGVEALLAEGIIRKIQSAP